MVADVSLVALSRAKASCAQCANAVERHCSCPGVGTRFVESPCPVRGALEQLHRDSVLTQVASGPDGWVCMAVIAPRQTVSFTERSAGLSYYWQPF